MCDAAVVAVVHSSLGADGTGEPLRLGRKTRKISPALRRALRMRDDGCQHPGCSRRRFLEAHHVVHWKNGGPTDLDNLVLVCRFHHMQVHENNFTVSSAKPGWTFRRPDGTVIPAVRNLASGPVAPGHTTPDHTTPDHTTPDAQGDGFSLAESVGVLCRAADGVPDGVPNPFAWLDGGSPNDYEKWLDQQKYVGKTDAEIKAILYPQPPAPSALDAELAATDFDQFDTFDALIAFCKASVFGTKATA